MTATVAALNIKLGANVAPLAGNLATAQGMLSAFTSKVNMGGGAGVLGQALGGIKAGSGGVMGMLSGVAGGITPITAAIAGLTAVVAGGTWAAKLASDAEQMRISFEVMLGSAGKAKDMLEEIKQFALDAPSFGTADLSQNAQALMQFGVEGERVVPIMRMLGDVSKGNKDAMGRLTLAFGQMSAAGRLMGQDLLQMINAGFNPLQEISKMTGISMADLKKKMEDGAISSDMVTAAFQSATSEGGRFFGMVQAQGNTFSGQWARFVENLQQAFIPVGKVILQVLTEILKIANEALEAWNRFWGNTPEKKAANMLPKFDKSIFDSLDGKKAEEAKAIAKAAEDAARALEKIRRDGESLTLSLRTPFERIVDELEHARSLFDAGAISAETWQRAMAKASQDLREQAESADQIRNRLRAQQGGPVAALQFGTQQAISAIAESRREEKLQIEVNRQILVEERKANDILRKTLDEIRSKRGVEITEVNL